MKNLAGLPVYETSQDGKRREGQFSVEDLHFAKDPINYHLSAYRRHGPIYKCWFRNQEWAAIGGLEANDFAWRQPDFWCYREATARFPKLKNTIMEVERIQPGAFGGFHCRHGLLP